MFNKHQKNFLVWFYFSQEGQNVIHVDIFKQAFHICGEKDIVKWEINLYIFFKL